MDRLICPVQKYAWGDPLAIPDLLGIEPDGDPQAELWMGTHERGPSVLASTGQPLDELLDEPLPFLFKVLAAAVALSIQTHPSRAQAEAGYERENRAGIPLGAPQRTYRDRNHKPELICALTDFDALCGFRPLADVRTLLATPGSDPLDPVRRMLASGSDEQVLETLVGWLLRLPASEVVEMIAALVDLVPASPEAELALALAAGHPGDPGALVAVLLNRITLAPGQAVFLPAGNLHAYLRGVGVELMANSDNVVRGGLTPKHVDVDELQEIVRFEVIDPPVQSPSGDVHRYHSPGAEFELTRIELGEPASLDVAGPEILIVVEGSADLVAASGDRLALDRGQVGFVAGSAVGYELTGAGLVFRASVPFPSDS